MAPGFPHHGLGAALASPNLLIRAAAGFPLRRGWKRRPAPLRWQLKAVILFREVPDSFRPLVAARLLELSRLAFPCLDGRFLPSHGAGGEQGEHGIGVTRGSFDFIELEETSL